MKLWAVIITLPGLAWPGHATPSHTAGEMMNMHQVFFSLIRIRITNTSFTLREILFVSMYAVQIVAGFNKIIEIEIKDTANVHGYGQCSMLNSAKLSLRSGLC